MLKVLALALLPATLAGQYSLYTCASEAREYIVGAKLPPGGLFRRTAAGWEHAGFNLPFLFSLDYDRTHTSTIYLAAGNGLIRASDHGRKWTILTGGDIAEVRDVALDPNAPGTIYFGYSRGIRVSRDSGKTWREIGAGLHRKFTEAIRVDRTKSRVLLAGGEEGIYRSEDAGQTWKLAGAAGFQVLHIEQSPHEPCLWLATTEGGGLFRSTDCGATFEAWGNIGVGRNLHDVEFDPVDPRRMAVSGWGIGVAVSDDLGKTWQQRNAGLPRPDVPRISFDPVQPGKIYAGVHQEALYVSPDYGKTWSRAGLEGSVVARMKFVPEGKAR